MFKHEVITRLDALSRQNERLFALVLSLVSLEKKMSAELDTLVSEVKTVTDVETSAVMLLNHLSDLIGAAGTDPVKLAQLTADLKASADTLARAVVDNTPAAPTPPAAPQSTMEDAPAHPKKHPKHSS